MNGGFLQSKEWGAFVRSRGEKTWFIEGSSWHALLVRQKLPWGMHYLYCPGGPVLRADDEEAWKHFLQDASRIAKAEKSIFLKVEPMTAKDAGKQSLLSLGLRASRKVVQPQKTRIVNLSVPEEELLASMHSKTRYNINLARKHGIKVYPSRENRDTELFLELLRKTSARDKFAAHADEYYRVLAREPFIALYLAERDGRVLAANMVAFFGEQAVYLHGASDYEQRRYMAPYLLQWEIMREAKKRGHATYDFWGIDDKRWPGLTRFKRSFGGEDISYIGSYDYVYNKILYAGYMLKQKLL